MASPTLLAVLAVVGVDAVVAVWTGVLACVDAVDGNDADVEAVVDAIVDAAVVVAAEPELVSRTNSVLQEAQRLV